MPKRKAKGKAPRTNIYIKPIDRELFEWAMNQRQSLSEVIALALYDYQKKLEKQN